MASEVGLKIDNRYEVLAELGRGGMGVVYKAMDTELERLVAIKVMTSHVADNPDYVSRFDAEARTAAKMQHPNIAVVYARGRHAGAPYIAMEFVEGTPLDKLISANAQVSILLKIDYIIQVCNALHYAHTEWKVVHRDVKPANIMVMKDGHRIKLLDFGIARANLSTATKSGMAIGTTFYMSPQQIRGERGLDGRSDIFSAGVVLYEVITGNVPWNGDSDFQVLAKIVNEPYPPLSNYLPSYPESLDRVLSRALAKDLTSRYQTAEEMAIELAELQAPLKEEIIEAAYSARDGGDLLRAAELASQILRIDTRHGRALALHNELQPQLLKKNERLRQLKDEAEQAVGKREFDRAISAISEAISINPTNAELQDLRKAIEQERERKKFVFNRLKLAQTAKEMNDLAAANKLIDEALEKDPTDTQARMMKTVLTRMAEDEKKKKRLQDLSDEIRGHVANRRFSEAYRGLKAVEELDPNYADLESLKTLARDAYAREERRKELESAIREVKKVLSEGNVERAFAATDQALKKFPDDSTLLRFRDQADAMRTASERQEEIKKNIADAWELSGKKQSEQAVRLLEESLQQHGADSQLRSALEQLRQMVERERVARAEQELLDRARQAMHVEDFESATRILRAGRIDYPSSSEIKQALGVAEEGVSRLTNAKKTRNREATEILEALLASEQHPDAQVRVVDDALRRNPDNERIQQIASLIRDRRQRLTPVVARAEELESAGQYAEAAREWQRVREIYAQYPQADSNIERLTRLAAPPPVATPAPTGTIAAPTGTAEFGATRLFDAGAAAAAAPAPTPTRPSASMASPTQLFQAPGAPPRAASTQARPIPELEVEAAVPASIEPRKKSPVPMIGMAAAGALVLALIIYFVIPKSSKQPTPTTTAATEATPAATPAAPATEAPITPPPAPAPGVLTGSVTVETNHPADLLVDGQKQGGVSGKQKIELPVGQHTVSVSNSDFEVKPATIAVNVRQGKDLLARFDLTPRKTEAAKATAPPAAPTKPAAPQPAVTAFSVDSTSLQQGKSTQLHWQTQNATEVTIDPGFPHQGASGSITISPGSTTTYRITAKGDAGTIEGSPITINVTAAPPPPAKPSIVVFTPGSDRIQSGQSTRLTWATQNATDVSIDPAVGGVDVNGYRDVSPTATTKYTLTAKSGGGSVSQSVTITVEAAVVKSQPEAPKKSPDLQAMEDIVARYKAANEHLSPDELQTVMPVSKDRRQSILDIAKDYSAVTYNISSCETPVINGDSAQYVCRQNVMYTDRKGKRVQGGNGTVVFSFKRAGGNWALQDVRGK
ncbi:MAG TPA: protein kinase [Terriglobales bacterium]|nr:protein kinase [Terriglobales bacterium]